MKELKKLINEIGFEYEREEKAIKGIEAIFSLVASRDFSGMKKLSQTKMGSAFLDIAEEYGANTECTMADWHWYKNKDGEIVRYSKPFSKEEKQIEKPFGASVVKYNADEIRN